MREPSSAGRPKGWMDMLRISMMAGLALLAAACGEGGGADRDEAGNIAVTASRGPAGYAASPPPVPVEVYTSEDLKAQGAPSMTFVEQEQGGGQPAAPPGQMMAYTYAWGFQVPTGNMEGLLNAHKKLCEDAGPARCYVVNSGISGLGQEYASGNLYLRATEEWVRSFEGGVESGLKPFDATLDSNSRSGEDLTTQIVDGEARLNSLKTMRDRLRELLASRPGRLSDLLEIEREMARVQAEIDSRESIMAALKLRVAMSTITLNYQPKYTAASESIWRPLGDAFSAFLPNFAQSLAGIVLFVGGFLPILIFFAIGIWLLMLLFRWIGRRRRRKTGPAASKPAANVGAGSP
jgi:Domain of unknown function (DUF4349)